MLRSNHVDDGDPSASGRDDWVTGSPGEGGVLNSITSIRADLEASFEAARERVAQRLAGTATPALEESRARSRDLLRQSRARARELLSKPALAKPGLPAVAIRDLHTLERLGSYVRHSVVRVCFYNLKLFCPSLVDEYDEDVKGHVIANMDQLDGVRKELDAFFGQSLSDGATVAAVFPEARRDAMRQLGALVELSGTTRSRLDEEGAREDYARRAPELIDGVMAALKAMQDELDARKIAVGDVLKQAVALSEGLATEAGLEVRHEVEPAPKVFGDEAHLLNGFTELIRNAAKHSNGAVLTVSLRPNREGGGWVEAAFADDGDGMTAEELASCLTRGASRGGTGEGLPMVVTIVEQEHLGQFEVTAEPGQGCRAVVRLPVKLDTTKGGPRTL